MASGSTPGMTVEARASHAPRPGTRVWMLRDGRFGRVVATAQGGLICRVRPENGGPDLECVGDELFRLSAVQRG